MIAMHDWTGSRIRADALTVPCRYCSAQPGTECWTKDRDPRPLTAFPAHEIRIRDALKASTSEAHHHCHRNVHTPLQTLPALLDE